MKILDSFNVRTKKPIDSRYQTSDLTQIKLPYEGLIVWHLTEKIFYKYTNGMFVKLFEDIETDIKTLTDSLNVDIENIGSEISDINKKLENKKILNVLDYGAYGDGVHDDTDSINTALALGGNIYFPKGTYNVNGLNVISNSNIFGDGDNSIIKLNNNVNKPVIKVDGQNNISFSSFYIDGNKSNQNLYDLCGIYLNNSNNIKMNNITVTNSYAHGIAPWADVKQCYIINCRSFSNGGCGLRTVSGDSQVYVMGGQYYSNGLSGVLLANATGSYLYGVKCFQNIADGENSNGISIQSDDVAVLNCESHDNYNAGIYSISNGTIIIGNHCYNNLLGCDLYHGTNLRYHFIVVGNKFHGNKSKGHSAYYCERIICSDNLIYDNGGTTNDNGFDYDSVRIVTLNNNIVEYNNGYGISFRSTNGSHQTSDIMITGNLLGQNSIGAYSIDSACSDYVYIKNNMGINENDISYQPSVPSSGVSFKNTKYRTATIIINGGTVTDININGLSTGSTSGSFRLAQGQSITITYSVAPTWSWFLD